MIEQRSLFSKFSTVERFLDLHLTVVIAQNVISQVNVRINRDIKKHLGGEWTSGVYSLSVENILGD